MFRSMTAPSFCESVDVTIPIAGGETLGHLRKRGGGLVVLPQPSPRNGDPRTHAIANYLHDAGLSTLVVNLLTTEEGAEDEWNGSFSMDLPLLAGRLMAIVDWARAHDGMDTPSVGFFAGGATAAAALNVAGQRPSDVRAVVSHNGRPDLAGESLPFVRAPTLLLVEAHDDKAIELHRAALAQLGSGFKELVIVPEAQDGDIDAACEHASGWFAKHLLA